MKYRDFAKGVFKITFLLILLLAVLSFFEFSKNYLYFTWASLFFFMGLTLFSGYYNSRSIKKPFFFNIFLGTLGLKFILSLAFIIIYLFVIEPPNKFFVVPFFALFIIYKSYETYMLLKFAREPDGK